MKILIISAVFPPEPVVSATLSFDIATALSRIHNITVLCPKPSRPNSFDFTEIGNFYGFKHIILKSYTCPESNFIGRLRESYSFGRACSKFIDKNNSIDRIYMNSWPIFGQSLVIKAAKRKHIPVITHVQDVYPESLFSKLPGFLYRVVKSLLLPLDKYTLINSDKVITISSKMSSYLRSTRNLNQEKLFVAYNYQESLPFLNYKTIRKASDQFVFMYLGNIGPVAGIDLLINAFRSKELKDARLIIAGSGSMKDSYNSIVATEGLNNITFLEVPTGKVPEIQSKADVLILPMKKNASLSSIPSKLPAYMFSSKPVIACVDSESDTAGAIKSANCGWVVPPDDVDELIMVMKESMNTDQLKREKLGENGFNFASLNYSKDVNLKKIVDIILS